MFMLKSIAVLAGISCLASVSSAQSYGFGKPATDAEIAGWNIDVSPDGKGLPPGLGNVSQGRIVYESSCAACHGIKGEGKPADRLVGGVGSLKSARKVKTIGSYWPYAPTMFDYIRRAMPYNSPQSLSADQVYAVTAYLLHMNGIVGPDSVMNAESLPKVRMPNRDGFVGDSRPDVTNMRCRTDCK